MYGIRFGMEYSVRLWDLKGIRDFEVSFISIELIEFRYVYFYWGRIWCVCLSG